MRLQHDLGKCYKTFLSSLMPLLAKPESKSEEYMLMPAQTMKKVTSSQCYKTFLAQFMRLLAKPGSKSNEYMMILAQIMKKKLY